MNGDAVKRIVALTRQKKSYLAMLKNNDLTLREADAMIELCNKEIAALRSQADLQLAPPGDATPKKPPHEGCENPSRGGNNSQPNASTHHTGKIHCLGFANILTKLLGTLGLIHGTTMHNGPFVDRGARSPY